MTTEIPKLENLVEVATVLGQQNDYEEILRVVAQKAAGLLNAETAVIMMVNPQTRQTVKTIFKEGQEGNQLRYHVAQTHISGWMIRHSAALMSATVKADSRFGKHVFEGMPMESALGVLLKKLEKRQPVDEITKSLHESLAEYEEQLIRQALAANHGNQSQTARLLKISEHTLRYKMRKMGIVKGKRR
ncbi:MAG: helix-turn-helix domain-containing protein [bacterium]